LLQLCRFLRGFSMPKAYFSQLQASMTSNFSEDSSATSLSAYNISEFSSVINSLLSLTMKCNLLAKLTRVLSRTIFGPTRKVKSSTSMNHEVGGGGGGPLTIKLLDSEEHAAVIAINAFLQNLFLYGDGDAVLKYQKYILEDTPLVSKLILPYIEVIPFVFI
jgi:hypothetical protein